MALKSPKATTQFDAKQRERFYYIIHLKEAKFSVFETLLKL